MKKEIWENIQNSKKLFGGPCTWYIHTYITGH